MATKHDNKNSLFCTWTMVVKILAKFPAACKINVDGASSPVLFVR